MTVYEDLNNADLEWMSAIKTELTSKTDTEVITDPVFLVGNDADALAIIHCGYSAVNANDAKLMDAANDHLHEHTLLTTIGNVDETAISVQLTLNEETTSDELYQRLDHIASKYRRPQSLAFYIGRYLNDLESWNAATIKTGFPKLDELTTGLHVGLYVVAGGSSVGKTTFAWQLADQMADQGRHVLYFSLEMSTMELMTKSIARRTQINNKRIKSPKLTEQVIHKMMDAADHYKNSTLSVIEGDAGYSMDDIMDAIKRYTRNNKTAPVVFIDYLQIIQPDENTKQEFRIALDQGLKRLRLLAKKLKTTIVVISSINRSNYLLPMGFEALKESGGIEYTSDGIFGLELSIIDVLTKTNYDRMKQDEITAYKRTMYDKHKNGNELFVRDVSLKILKNRAGQSTGSVMYYYDAPLDTYTEKTDEDVKKWNDHWWGHRADPTTETNESEEDNDVE